MGSASDNDALPDPDIDPNPKMDEDWASYRGDASHARYIEDGHEFDGEALETAWSAEHNGPVAVAHDTVYVAVADDSTRTTYSDGVVALDAEDGSVVWENTDIAASDLAVVGETVYLTGDEVVALDRSNGSVRWTTDFDPEEPISNPTVAYDGVFVAVDGTLYALESDDGSVRWKKTPVTEDVSKSGEKETFEYEFANPPLQQTAWCTHRETPVPKMKD